MTVVGLVGGIGSGKSFVARAFGRLGAAVIDADALAHACLAEDGVRAEISAEFGPEATAADGVDRAALARIVFRDPARLARLNAIVHPCVLRRIDSALAEQSSSGERRVVILDAPLLLETGLDRRCHHVVFVKASRAARAARVHERNGWSPEELDRREKNQKALDDKEAAADYSVTNEGPEELLLARIQAIYDDMARRSPSRPGSPPPSLSGDGPTTG